MKRIEKIVRFLSVGKSRVEKITNLANKSAKKNKSRILYFLFACIHILNGTDHNHCITIFHLIVSRYALFTPTHPFQWRQMKQTTQIRKYIKKNYLSLQLLCTYSLVECFAGGTFTANGKLTK